jgi:PTS system nitrogen regulatory IIA component
LISLCYLESPLDMQAGDGRPVWILFTIVSPTVKTHLGLLSRLAAVLLDGDFGATVKAAGSREEILREASRVDSHLLCGRIRVEERRS